MNTQSQDFKKYELIDDEVPITQSTWQKLTTKLKRLGQWVWNQVTTKPELKIRQCKDRAGNVWYQVYNPNTGRTAYLASEEEVRFWIEESFYQRHV
ncbi:hypothetical protein H6G96_36845 [Nostoc sp. FACHB-892]|uniref:hypothetical protein n=1 Tax=unclassified Nostoc TaxID=2593658 RepID=UPI001682DEEB|nr:MULTISPECIES: hypothetical protein [unclassified Nostoc]MBD2731699.1 hypothetical protein [Nostoc sp. FACHB-892]MDZ7950700.1 hypothetical protein [Nostoc sp. DedQUE09]